MANTKTATKKTRDEQSKELFKNIREYNLLGCRIGDGLHNMFNTLVTAISKKKASVNPVYNYTVYGGTSLVVFKFGISVARKKDSLLYYVDVVVNKENPGKTGLRLIITPKAPKLPTVKDFQFSEQGIKDMLKEIKVIK